MKIIAAFFTLFVTSSLWAVTPEFGVSTFESFDLECPSGQRCTALDPTFCSKNNIEISPNDDGSFDIVFNNFNVITNGQADYASAGCLLDIPITVPSNQQVALEEVSIAGVTVVAPGGRATASITHFVGGRESTRTEAFVEAESFVVTHAQELSSEYSDCGSGAAGVSTRINITASRGTQESDNTFMNLSSGAGRLKYRLDYQDCTPEPETCASGQFEIDGVCYNLGSQCSDYHATNSAVCNNSQDGLSCGWDVKRSLCRSECQSNQFNYNGNCYDIASSCSEYDSTNTQICNNGSDSLYCDWIAETETCVNECSSDSTFEIDGQCYQKNGSCSQYNGTNTNTCNNGQDSLYCSWIPNNYPDSDLAGICADECPSDSFELDGQCFKHNDSCGQFNGTNSATCNNPNDDLSCDWIPTTYDDSNLAGTCVAECPSDAFKLDGQCFKHNGSCGQFNGTNSTTCNNQTDGIDCDWIPATYDDSDLAGTCVTQCPSDSFELDGQCFKNNDSCDQFNGTNSATCNNPNDNLSCDWIPSTYGDPNLTNTCVDTCPSDAFKIDGQCYQYNGNCSQYNGTNTDTCNNQEDSFPCDWIPDTYGDRNLANTCVDTCPSDAFKINGQCYQHQGKCSQYNGTDSKTCKNRQDSMACDWNSHTKVCSPR